MSFYMNFLAKVIESLWLYKIIIKGIKSREKFRVSLVLSLTVELWKPCILDLFEQFMIDYHKLLLSNL